MRTEFRREAVIGDVVEIEIDGKIFYGIYEAVINGMAKVDLQGNSKRILVPIDEVKKV